MIISLPELRIIVPALVSRILATSLVLMVQIVRMNAVVMMKPIVVSLVIVHATIIWIVNMAAIATKELSAVVKIHVPKVVKMEKTVALAVVVGRIKDVILVTVLTV